MGPPSPKKPTSSPAFHAPGKLNAKELVEVVKKVGYKTTWGTHYGLDLIFTWTLPIGSMGRLYIYLHEWLKFYVEFW